MTEENFEEMNVFAYLANGFQKTWSWEMLDDVVYQETMFNQLIQMSKRKRWKELIICIVFYINKQSLQLSSQTSRLNKYYAVFSNEKMREIIESMVNNSEFYKKVYDLSRDKKGKYILDGAIDAQRIKELLASLSQKESELNEKNATIAQKDEELEKLYADFYRSEQSLRDAYGEISKRRKKNGKRENSKVNKLMQQEKAKNALLIQKNKQLEDQNKLLLEELSKVKKLEAENARLTNQLQQIQKKEVKIAKNN